VDANVDTTVETNFLCSLPETLSSTSSYALDMISPENEERVGKEEREVWCRDMVPAGRDLRMLRFVGEYRVVWKSLVRAWEEGLGKKWNKRCDASLTRLVRAGLLIRLARRPREEGWYVLSEEGRKMLLVADELVMADSVRVFNREKLVGLQKRHWAMGSLYRGCWEIGGAGVYEGWANSFEVQERLESGREEKIRPDGGLVLRVNGKREDILLEFETGFFSSGKFRRVSWKKMVLKYREYMRWLREGGPRRCGFEHGVRVLTVCRTEEFVEFCMRAAIAADERGDGSRMLIFTSEKRFGLDRPAAVVGQIYQWANSDDRFSLV
jgi:hypothetical protein